VNVVNIKMAIAISVLTLSLCACRRDGYEVVGRTNDEGRQDWVKVVLTHDGHKFHAICNNLKGTKDRDVNLRCNLHVGQTVRCKFFPDRMAADAYGYDLICGDELTSDKIGDPRNELLIVQKEEQ
jgi:hypothetical protein